MVGDDPTVLVTAADAGRRDLYDVWLADDVGEVLTAADGEATLERASPDVDIAILDRDAPGPSGLDLAEQVAAAADDPYVVLVGAGREDFDLGASPVQAYLRKPVREPEVRAALETYRTRRDYHTAIEEFYALTAKVAAIEARRSAEALAADERYRRLQWLVDEKRAEVDEALERAAPDWASAFRSLVEHLPGRGRSGRV